MNYWPNRTYNKETKSIKRYTPAGGTRSQLNNPLPQSQILDMHGCAGARGSDDGSGEGDSRDCGALPDVSVPTGPNTHLRNVSTDAVGMTSSVFTSGKLPTKESFPGSPLARMDGDKCGWPRGGGRGEGAMRGAIGTLMPIF